jgi:hypothetical protein
MGRLLRVGPALLMLGPAVFHWLRAQFALRVLSDSAGATAAMGDASVALSMAVAGWVVFDVLMMRWLPDQVLGRRGWLRSIWNLCEPIVRAGLMTTLYVGQDGILRTADAAMLGSELLIFAANLPAVVWLRRAARLRN